MEWSKASWELNKLWQVCRQKVSANLQFGTAYKFKHICFEAGIIKTNKSSDERCLCTGSTRVLYLFSLMVKIIGGPSCTCFCFSCLEKWNGCLVTIQSTAILPFMASPLCKRYGVEGDYYMYIVSLLDKFWNRESDDIQAQNKNISLILEGFAETGALNKTHYYSCSVESSLLDKSAHSAGHVT